MPIWLIILLSTAALIMFLMYMQIQLCVVYDGKFSFYVRYMFFTFGNKKKVKGKTKQKKKLKEQKNKPKKLSLEKVKDYIDLFKELWEKVEPLLARFRRNLIVNDLTLDLVIGGDDAAKTAIYYGEACSVIFPALSFIETELKVKKKHVSVECDFNGSSTVNFHANVGIRLITMNIIGIIVLVRTILVLVKNQLTVKKGEYKNG